MPAKKAKVLRKAKGEYYHGDLKTLAIRTTDRCQLIRYGFLGKREIVCALFETDLGPRGNRTRISVPIPT